MEYQDICVVSGTNLHKVKKLGQMKPEQVEKQK